MLFKANLTLFTFVRIEDYKFISYNPKNENQSIFVMTTLTPDYLHLFNVLGLKAIYTFNRDIIYNFNLLNGQ